MTQIKVVARLNQKITHPLATVPGMYLALAIILGVLGMLAAALYLAPQSAVQSLVLLGVGLPIALLLWHRPEFGLLALLFLASSFVPANIVDVRLPIGGGLDLRDLILIGLFGVVCLRELLQGTLKVSWWPVGGPLLLFLIMAVFSTFYAMVLENVESNWALGDLRILSLYTTFFITLWSIKRPEQLKTLLVGLFIIANLTTLIIYLQQFLGADNPLLQSMIMTRDWRVYQGVGAVRVVPAGQVLMHFMWFVALGQLLLSRPSRLLKVFYVAQLLFIGGGHLYTYMRAQWIALIIGLVLVIIILVPSYKQHWAKIAVIAGSVSFIIISLVAGGFLSDAPATPFVTGITDRFGSILTPTDTSETESLQWRSFENEQALQAIRKQPLTGVGLGNRYRALSTNSSEASGSLTQGNIATGDVSRFTRYVHNSYASIAVKMGIPGFLVLVWFCAAVLFKGYQAFRAMPDSEHKGVVLGVLTGFAGLLVWCYFHAHLIKAESTATIGLMVALIGTLAFTFGNGYSLRPNSGAPTNNKGIDRIL